jgi:hypothetical protein
METIRAKLSRKRRRLYFAMLAAFVVFALGMTAGMKMIAFMFVGVVGFAAAMVCVAAMMFWVRCPACGGNLGYALSVPVTWDFSVSKKIRFCQFCGVDLDKEVEPKKF